MAGFLSSVAGSVSNFLAGDKTEIEKKLDQALSKENWGAPSSLLRDIASATTDSWVPARGRWLALGRSSKGRFLSPEPWQASPHPTLQNRFPAHYAGHVGEPEPCG